MEDAIQKAEGFLEKHHTAMDLESSSLEGGNWCLVFDVGFLRPHLKEIKINAISGKIVGYASIDAGGEDD